MLARDAEGFERYRAITKSLSKFSRNADLIYREIALEHLDELARRVGTIASLNQPLRFTDRHSRPTEFGMQAFLPPT